MALCSAAQHLGRAAGRVTERFWDAANALRPARSRRVRSLRCTAMKILGARGRLDRDTWVRLVAGLGVVLVAILLFTRYSIYGFLDRDEAIYAYGGQQLTHGVPPYASIFDPKGPGATLLSGLGAAIAHLIGRNDVLTIRLVFFVCAVLTVLAVYLLALQLWESLAAAVIAALVFTSFAGWARDALVGPDAKMPGVLCAVVAMWLAARRQWFWSAVAGSLAVIVWQPLALYPVVTLVAAVVNTPAQRWRALGITVAGFVLPMLAISIYFASAGAFGKLIESAVVFPLTGYRGGGKPLPAQLGHIELVTYHYYGLVGTVLIHGGLAALSYIAVRYVVNAGARRREALRNPVVLVVLVTLIGQLVFMIGDFHNYPRVYPMLPYAAIGVGGAVALTARALRREERNSGLLRAATAVLVVVAAALVGQSWVTFTDSAANNDRLRVEQALACALSRMLVPGHPLWSLGSPTPLVFMHRRNPDRFIYLDSGVDAWKVKHTSGGFAGWTAQIAEADPSVLVVTAWKGTYRPMMKRWLHAAGYHPRFLGIWRVFVSPGGLDRASAAGILLTTTQTHRPLTTAGSNFTNRMCGRS